MTSPLRSKSYHDFVIKDGKFIGEFERMYQECENPWPENHRDLDNNPVACHTARLIRRHGFRKIFTVGSGKGLHADWLMRKVPYLILEGCEISKTAIAYCRRHYPKIKTYEVDIKNFGEHTFDFDLILFREALWYILPYWEKTVEVLKKKYSGRHILIELSCYDQQQYGMDYFDGPEDIIKKFPFKLKETLRHHTTPEQREGMISVFGEI